MAWYELDLSKRPGAVESTEGNFRWPFAVLCIIVSVCLLLVGIASAFIGLTSFALWCIGPAIGLGLLSRYLTRE